MNDAKLLTLEQLRGFLAGTVDLGLTAVADPAARYGLIKTVLKRYQVPAAVQGPSGSDPTLPAACQRLLAASAGST